MTWADMQTKYPEGRENMAVENIGYQRHSRTKYSIDAPKAAFL